MREAAEKKKDLEKQHGEAVNELRTAQAQLGLLANNKNTEVERAQHSQNIESLQVGIDCHGAQDRCNHRFHLAMLIQ